MNASITATLYDPREGERDAAGGPCSSGMLGRPGRRQTVRPRRRRGVACIRSCFRPTLLSLSPTAGATLALYSSQNRGAGRMNDVYIIESWFDERLNKCNVHARPDRQPKLQVQQHDSTQLNGLGQW